MRLEATSGRTRGYKVGKIALVFAATLLAQAVVIGGFASPAAAVGTYDPVCPDDDPYGHVCMFYNDYFDGANNNPRFAVSDFYNPRTYFPHNCGLESDGRPKPSCAGGGQHFWNNIASAINFDDRCVSVIWYDPNYKGPSVALAVAGAVPYNEASLESTNSPLWNNNRAVSWRC